MGNLSLVTLGNLDPLSWLFNLVKPIMLFADGDGGDGGGADGGDGGGGADGGDKGGDGGDKGGDKGGSKTGTFYEGWTPEVSTHPSITKFKSSEELGKGYINLEKKIDAKGVLLLSETSTKEEIDAHQIALGRPEKVEAYTFDAVEGVDAEKDRLQANPELEGAFKTKCFELGISSKVANELNKWYVGTQLTALKTYDTTTEESKNAAETKLRGEFGNTVQGRLVKVNRLLTVAGGDDMKDYISRNGNDPALTRTLFKIADMISEDSLGPLGSGGFAMAPAEALAEIKKMNNDTKNPIYDANHPDHKEALAKRDSLYKIAYPSGQGA